MLACRIHAKDDLRVEPQAMPAVGENEVLLRLGAGGICGSDLHYYFEGRNGSFVVREPLIPGHEASAVVAAVGSAVTRVKKGDKVAVSPSHACGRCGYCREGREQLCEHMRFLGSASRFPHVQGMFCEYFVMGERQCYPVADDVSLGEIAFAEPLAVALHAVHRAGDVRGRDVVVNGAGPIGSLVVAAARYRGAASVVAADLSDASLAVAKAMGADEVRNLPGTAVSAVLGDLVTREITWVGAYRFVEEIGDALVAMRDGLDVSPLITHRFDLDDAAEALAVAADRTSGSSKVMLRLGSERRPR